MSAHDDEDSGPRYTRQQRFHDGMTVHRAWSDEERLLTQAYQALIATASRASPALFSHRPIRILDLGAGTGDLGASVIQSIASTHPGTPLRYHGIDSDPEYRETILGTCAQADVTAAVGDIFSTTMLDDLSSQAPWDIVLINNVGYYALDEAGHFSRDKFSDFVNRVKAMSKIAVFVHTPSISNTLETLFREQSMTYDCVARMDCSIPIKPMQHGSEKTENSEALWSELENPAPLSQRGRNPYASPEMLAFRLVFESRNGALIRDWEALPGELRKQLVGEWKNRVVNGVFHSQESMHVLYGDHLCQSEAEKLHQAFQGIQHQLAHALSPAAANMKACP